MNLKLGSGLVLSLGWHDQRLLPAAVVALDGSSLGLTLGSRVEVFIGQKKLNLGSGLGLGIDFPDHAA